MQGQAIRVAVTRSRGQGRGLDKVPREGGDGGRVECCGDLRRCPRGDLDVFGPRTNWKMLRQGFGEVRRRRSDGTAGGARQTPRWASNGTEEIREGDVRMKPYPREVAHL